MKQGGTACNWQVGATCKIKIQEIDNTKSIFMSISYSKESDIAI